MSNQRSAGILLPISAMPSPYGIGVFGEHCFTFLEQMVQMGFHHWQVLPFNITDSANSPYCSPSAFAGNYLFIDPKGLQDMGLLTEQEVLANQCPDSPYTANYAFAKEHRLTSLHLALSRLSQAQKVAFNQFKEKEESWLEDFALFMAVKDDQGGTPWWQWDAPYLQYESCTSLKRQFADTINFWCFTQYIFYMQWEKVKAFATAKGIAIIGDIPIYVAMDSVDVWRNTDQFRLDKQTFVPLVVAGVPPDYFSEDGQLWGNPIYDWDAMEQTDFCWWCTRIAHALTIYDTLRIDHFRAFASYWEVPADATTAKVGTWKKGPGMKLFNALRKQIESPQIIAEDLGLFGKDVVQLLADSGFPGMRVIQFGFDPNADSEHLPHNYPKNSVAYVGTHDNNTILGWLWDATPTQRAFALDYCGFEGENWGEGGYHSASCRKLIEAVWKSTSNLAIVAIQDMCGFGKDARMNIPGVPQRNWCYRTTSDTLAQIDTQYFKKINAIYRRT